MTTLELRDGRFLLRAAHPALAKRIPGAAWSKGERAWAFPVRPETFDRIRQTFQGVRVAPNAVEAVREIQRRESIAARMKARGWKDAEPLEPMPIQSKPFRHQILAYNVGLVLPATALLMEQGCGKTLTAIAIAGRRFLRGEVKRCLVVAPASVVPVWPMEFERHADFPHDVQALEGPVVKRKKTLTTWKPDPFTLQVAVTNYEATWRMTKELAAWGPDLIICDESQRIKTPGAKQSKALHTLGARARFRMILTGTPVTNNPTDFFSQYKFLDPSIFGNNFYAFRNRYCVMGGYQNYEIVDYKNLEELVDKAHRIAVRVTKAEALDLPPTVDQTLYCDLEPQARRVYKDMVAQSVAELEEGTVTAANVLTRLLRLSQITGGFTRIDEDEDAPPVEVSKAKLVLLSETLEDLLDAGKKVVVFARFIPEIRAIESILERKGIGYVTITGETKDRGEAVRRFQEHEGVRVFVGQIQTVREGLTLTAADTAIFYSLDFSYANYEQAKARIHRIGQRNTCTYIHLVARKTVDERIMKALEEKRNIADLVVDRWRELLS